MLRKLLVLFAGLIMALIIGEIFLRIFNPIPFRVKGNKIILPINQKYLIGNNINSRLDTLIVHTKNDLGFRGVDKPKDLDNYISIIAVGGSTTECYYLNDGKDWVNIVGDELKTNYDNIWINNAGLDGHSTFGHQILLEDYLININPKIILFLTGCNDVLREDLNQFDKDKLQGESNSIKIWLKENSEIIDLMVNIKRVLDSKKRNLSHRELSLEYSSHIEVNKKEIDLELKKHLKYLLAYRNRLEKLALTCINNGITAVFITQPTLVGIGSDPITGIDLETIEINKNMNGKTYWETLELYNDVMREISNNKNLLLIDLARELPKNSKYYYDGIHFTNEGSKMVGKIVAKKLETALD